MLKIWQEHVKGSTRTNICKSISSFKTQSYTTLHWPNTLTHSYMLWCTFTSYWGQLSKTIAQFSLIISLKSMSVYIKTCAHSYMTTCCGQHNVTTWNTDKCLNMHFIWRGKDMQDICKELQEHVQVQENTYKGYVSLFLAQCGTCVGLRKQINEWRQHMSIKELILSWQ
jgi:hypothetical protein